MPLSQRIEAIPGTGEGAGKLYLIQMIESRTRYKVIEVLKAHGIHPGSGQAEYSTAKRACFQGQVINSSVYDKQLRWICDYLRI